MQPMSELLRVNSDGNSIAIPFRSIVSVQLKDTNCIDIRWDVDGIVCGTSLVSKNYDENGLRTLYDSICLKWEQWLYEHSATLSEED